jgi:superfamily II DNA or RNA helicase
MLEVSRAARALHAFLLCGIKVTGSLDDRCELAFHGGTLTLRGISRGAVTRLFGPSFWVADPRAGVWRCDAWRYAEVRTILCESGWPFVDSVAAWEAVAWPNVAIPKLRPEQEAAVNAWRAARRGCIVMPTGTGKTETALAIMAEVQAATLVVAPVRDLMHQWHRRILAGLGYDAGVIGDSVFRVRPVSVTTYDSAYLHMERLGDRFKLIVFDECHHLPGALRRDAARMSAAPFRLGLTATIERSDGRHVDLGWLIGPTVYEMPLSAAKGRALADYEVVRIAVHLSEAEQARYDRLSLAVRGYMAERTKTEGRFTWEDLCNDTGVDPAARRALKAYREKTAIEDRAEEKLRVLEDLFRLHAGEPVLVFAGSNAMARAISLRFLIPCLLNHCGKHERREVLEGLAVGAYPALVANQVLDEGVDLPQVNVAIVVGGTASSRQAKQRLGRILRKSGNRRAVLYEIVCADTTEEKRSRKRRASDAYQGTRRRRRS